MDQQAQKLTQKLEQKLAQKLGTIGASEVRSRDGHAGMKGVGMQESVQVMVQMLFQ